METGLFQKILLDDGGEVLVVGDVLGKDHEGHGNVGPEEGLDVVEVDSLDAMDGFLEGELGSGDEGFEGDGGEQVGDRGEVDDLQCVDAGGVANDGDIWTD